ncbi:MAG: hypothetical protein KF821_03115 [Anaerolineales bacterium]|nr:hypothetical protein [Anaerolineales bacterium]
MQNTAQQTAIFFGNAPIEGIAPYSVIEESLGAGGTLRQRMPGKIIYVSFGPWHAAWIFQSVAMPVIEWPSLQPLKNLHNVVCPPI